MSQKTLPPEVNEKSKQNLSVQSIDTNTDVRFDPEAIINWNRDLKNAGVPQEIIDEFEPTFFLKDGDDLQTDDPPESFLNWVKENPGRFKSSIINDEKPPIENVELVREREQPQERRSLLSRFWNAEPAVKFDRHGNATVDESRGEYDIDKKKVLIAVGSVALVGVGMYLAKYGFDNPFNGAGDAGGGIFDGNITDSSADVNVPDTTSLPEDSGRVSAEVNDNSTDFKPTDTSAESSKQIGWTTEVGNGDGVSQLAQNWFESQGANFDAETMKQFVDEAMAKGLLSPEHVSGLVPMDVNGGYGFPSAGQQTTFSPEMVEYMRHFLEENNTKVLA